MVRGNEGRGKEKHRKASRIGKGQAKSSGRPMWRCRQPVNVRGVLAGREGWLLKGRERPAARGKLEWDMPGGKAIQRGVGSDVCRAVHISGLLRLLDAAPELPSPVVIVRTYPVPPPPSPRLPLLQPAYSLLLLRVPLDISHHRSSPPSPTAGSGIAVSLLALIQDAGHSPRFSLVAFYWIVLALSLLATGALVAIEALHRGARAAHRIQGQSKGTNKWRESIPLTTHIKHTMPRITNRAKWTQSSSSDNPRHVRGCTSGQQSDSFEHEYAPTAVSPANSGGQTVCWRERGREGGEEKRHCSQSGRAHGECIGAFPSPRGGECH